MSRQRPASVRLYTPKIHPSELEAKLHLLLPFVSLPIASLPAEALAAYNHVQGLIRSETLDYEVLKKVFNGVSPVPGTVGGAFAGCLNSNQFPQEPACALSCVNSVQNPDSPQCQVRVYQASLGRSGYTFHYLNESTATIHHRAYIYVDAYSLTTFRGFTEDEKAILYHWGITEVAIISPRQPNGEYVDLMDGFVPLADIKVAIQPIEPESSGSPIMAGVGVFILILLIILFLAWITFRR